MTSTGTTRTFIADPIHSGFGFAIEFLGGSIYRARFEEAEAKLDTSVGQASLVGRATAASISIHHPESFRNHVLGPDFFSAEEHPEVSFHSTMVDLADNGTATVVGDLTVKGIKRAITARGKWTAPSAGPSGDQRAALSLEAKVNRRDFDMTWDAPLPDGRSALADEVTLTVDLALVGVE